ncbi:thiosulfate oxidation carrier complex protein SoxZ [Marinobacter panjinensis]|uniref:Thiosulfate oxidation carrier complex protein SoxZ n=1 Tax=Marinobacter panjinensis TaxID=2576384 RepID=A0A4U6R2I3_9GAMM|nr:thiosulfate oxidation carrier complex protein SoxZ [Marinobacter panjinensis]MCR8916023.1 thiosulfate oxidation carrier complex protein SoxZ [Marinobacter panjinensis]TKV67012.1 thiosulfate oxidation carrier complex protein SoxZ [Marinobacter panjinensis]
MASSIRVRAVESGGVTSLKALVRHPMDSGFVKDSEGNVIPPHFIKVLTVSHKGKNVFVANWGPAVSKDPFLEFRFKGGKKGDEVTISWVDNEGESDSTTATIG